MLSFHCHACGQKIKVAEMLAGQGIRCPRCRQTVRVPHEQPHLGTQGPKIDEQRTAEHAVAPTLSDLAERETLRAATAPPAAGDELKLQPVMPPPLRKHIVARPETAIAPTIAPPVEDDDEFKLQPLAPPPLRKPPRRE